MDIIDSHHHLWDTSYQHYSLFDSIPILNRPYTINDFNSICESHNVQGSVCVEAASAGADGRSEVSWLIDQSKRSSVPMRIVAWTPLDRKIISEYLRYLNEIGQGKIVGLRHSFEFEPSDYPARQHVLDGVKLMAGHGFSFDVVIYQRSLTSALQLVRACPEVHFILDHLGKPDIRNGDVQMWATQLLEISRCENLDCKISGLSTEADHLNWTGEQLKPFILHAIDCFGWDRLMFGSDWPVCNLTGGFERWIDALLSAIDDASEENRRKLLFDDAWRIYQFNQI